MDIDIDDLFDVEPAEGGETAREDNPLFSDHEEEGNDEGNPAPEQAKKPDDVDVDVAASEPKKKRVVRPQPKLDCDRLCGPRGIGVLEQTFAHVRFKGKGHEREDLRLLMTKMEHWAHRLFPKMPFDNVLERMERLGKTKQVHANLRKVRMGMDICPTIINDEDDTVRGDGRVEVDAFDELLGAELPVPARSAREASPDQNPEHDTQTSPRPEPTTMTDEQLEQMRRNREAAQLRRMRAKFQHQQQDVVAVDGSSRADGDARCLSQAPSSSDPGQASAVVPEESARPRECSVVASDGDGVLDSCAESNAKVQLQSRGSGSRSPSPMDSEPGSPHRGGWSSPDRPRSGCSSSAGSCKSPPLSAQSHSQTPGTRGASQSQYSARSHSQTSGTWCASQSQSSARSHSQTSGTRGASQSQSSAQSHSQTSGTRGASQSQSSSSSSSQTSLDSSQPHSQAQSHSESQSQSQPQLHSPSNPQSYSESQSQSLHSQSQSPTQTENSSRVADVSHGKQQPCVELFQGNVDDEIQSEISGSQKHPMVVSDDETGDISGRDNPMLIDDDDDDVIVARAEGDGMFCKRLGHLHPMSETQTRGQTECREGCEVSRSDDPRVGHTETLGDRCASMQRHLNLMSETEAENVMEDAELEM